MKRTWFALCYGIGGLGLSLSEGFFRQYFLTFCTNVLWLPGPLAVRIYFSNFILQIIMAPALSIYFSRNGFKDRTLWKLFLFSVIGGVLGMIGLLQLQNSLLLEGKFKLIFYLSLTALSFINFASLCYLIIPLGTFDESKSIDDSNELKICSRTLYNALGFILLFLLPSFFRGLTIEIALSNTLWLSLIILLLTSLVASLSFDSRPTLQSSQLNISQQNLEASPTRRKFKAQDFLESCIQFKFVSILGATFFLSLLTGVSFAIFPDFKFSHGTQWIFETILVFFLLGILLSSSQKQYLIAQYKGRISSLLFLLIFCASVSFYLADQIESLAYIFAGSFGLLLSLVVVLELSFFRYLQCQLRLKKYESLVQVGLLQNFLMLAKGLAFVLSSKLIQNPELLHPQNEFNPNGLLIPSLMGIIFSMIVLLLWAHFKSSPTKS